MAILIQYANGVPGVKFSLDKAEITLGRGLDNDISIDDEFVSKHHAVIQIVEDELTSNTHCILIDNSSTNHTFVNNRKVTMHKLEDKDKIFIGQNEFRFSPESISVVDTPYTQNGFYDDAPGLMNECIQKSNLSTTRVTEHKPNIIPDSPPDNISVNDLPTNVMNDLGNAMREEESTENKKRFSRRLTLL